jgi:hypothetical protein
VHYPLVVATDALLEKFGGLQGLPTTMLYDRQGVLHKKLSALNTLTFSKRL